MDKYYYQYAQELYRENLFVTALLLTKKLLKRTPGEVICIWLQIKCLNKMKDFQKVERLCEDILSKKMAPQLETFSTDELLNFHTG